MCDVYLQVARLIFVQVMLECGVESLVGVVTRELRPVNLLPASMREAHPFLVSLCCVFYA